MDYITIRAKFKGTNGSLGYKTDKEYQLKFWVIPTHGVSIQNSDGTGYCPYSKLKTFLDNWEVIG